MVAVIFTKAREVLNANLNEVAWGNVTLERTQMLSYE